MSKANLLSKLSSLTGIVKLTSGDPSALIDTDSITFADYNLNALSSTLTGTAVAVFVYDTRTDSDGGAWRKRCQHTSWYNETLNTATRGATREFPAVALCILESGKLTIYDATVSSCPMWMVFNPVAWGNVINSVSGQTCTLAINGKLFVGHGANGTGCADFVSDNSYKYLNTSLSSSNSVSTIADRNVSGSGNNVIATLTASVPVTVQCITATILPTTPIDATTGLPNPTVYVGTLGGVSRIAADGTVSNWTDSVHSSTYAYTKTIAVIGKYVYWGTDSSSLLARYNLVQSILSPLVEDSVFSTSYYHYSGYSGEAWATYKTPYHYGGTSSSNARWTSWAVASNRSLTLLQPNTTTWGQGLHATITKDFNSGYQFGDIRGAWLCQGTAETLTAADLVTGDSSTFTSGVGSWVASGSGDITFSASGGVLSIVRGSGGINGRPEIAITTVIGKTYVLTFTGGGTSIACGIGYSTGNLGILGGTLFGIGTFTFSFTAVSTTTFIAFWPSPSTTTTLDNVTVKLADPDVSYKNQALEVVGSLTKSAVASGAELMAYSGFSASNYLTQAYNSNLDFGTGAFYVTGWLYYTASGTNTIFERSSIATGTATGNNYIAVDLTSSVLNLKTYEGVLASYTTSNPVAAPTNTWVHFCAMRDSSGNLLLYQNGAACGNTQNNVAIRNVTNASAEVTVGMRRIDASIDTARRLQGSLALLHIGAGNPSAAQIKAAYEAERPLFQANVKCLLAGTSNDVKAIDYDESTGIHHLVTGNYYNAFKGLQRVDSTAGVWTSISAKNDYIIKGA